MTRELYVHVPVCVPVTVDFHGEIVSVGRPAVDWDGMPWSEAPNIWDEQADEWIGHRGDETSWLWPVEERAADAVAHPREVAE